MRAGVIDVSRNSGRTDSLTRWSLAGAAGIARLETFPILCDRSSSNADCSGLLEVIGWLFGIVAVNPVSSRLDF